jgi:hypothetical protein
VGCIPLTTRIAFVSLAALCLGCSLPTNSKSVSTSESSVASTSTISTLTSTTTTQVPLISNLKMYVDPIGVHLPEFTFIRETLEQMERRFPIKPGTVAILYTSSEPAIDWVKRTARSVRCFADHGSSHLRGAGGEGRGCGFLMRFDSFRVCQGQIDCKDVRFVAAHEFFHTLVGITLGSFDYLQEQTVARFRRVPFWIHEGTADYVAYAMTRSESMGSLSVAEVDELRMALKDVARDPSINRSLKSLESIWRQAPAVPTPGQLYPRSLLAVTLLIEKFGEQAVLFDYFNNVSSTGSGSAGFKQTFGITEDQFDDEFQAWINAL